MAGIAIATVFAVIASLAHRPVDNVQPFPELPGPVIADDRRPETATTDPTTPAPSSIAAMPPTTASRTITKPKPKPPAPKPSTTQAALPPQPAPQPPVARFTVNCSDLSCGFDGTGSSDPDGTVIYYAWGFGDGSDDNFQNRSRLTHRYPRPGTYTVTLVVLDNSGEPGQTTRTITVR